MGDYVLNIVKGKIKNPDNITNYKKNLCELYEKK